MPIPSLPISVVGLILAPVDRKSLARCARVQKSWLPLCQQQLYHSLTLSRRRELDDQHRDPPLLATLQSCPALAAHVRKLDFNGWYQDWEAFGDDGDGDDWSDEEDEPPMDKEPPTVPDDLYLAQLLKCCTGLRRLEVHGAYLWIDDLVFTPKLVSLTFADGTRLRSRQKKPELLALPPIMHLNTGSWEQPPASNRRTLFGGISIMDFDDLGPASISLFSSLTHLDVDTLGYRTPEDFSNALQQITPNVQSLTLANDQLLLTWKPLLPLCTSLKQFGCMVSSPRAPGTIHNLRHLPPSLAFLLLGGRLHRGRQDSGNEFIGAITRSIEGLQGLKTLQLDSEFPLAWRVDLEYLEQLCKRKGAALRLRHPNQNVGRRLVAPKRGEKEVKWTKIWSQLPL